MCEKMSQKQQSFIHLFSLLKTKGIGFTIAKKLLDEYHSAEEIFKFNETELKKIFKGKKDIIQQILEQTHFKSAQNELQFMQETGIQYVLYSDENYPKLLKNCSDAPLILYYKGKAIWNDKPNISIVGTRNCTSYGKEITQELVSNFSALNCNLVSGLALGIDTEVHQTSNQNKTPNFAILAHGLHTIYPKQNVKYIPEIIQNGAIITEYSSQDAFRKENFLQRNRIIAGMSSHTIIVESKFGGGAMTTARMAFNYDRELFAIPGKISDEISQGCNFLIKNNQAQILLHPQEVFQWFGKENTKPLQKELFIELSEDEKSIVDLVKKEEKLQIDQLAYLLNKPTYILTPILLELEFKEVIKQLPGKFFTLN